MLGRAATVTCTFKTSGGSLSATFEVPAIPASYSSSYNISERSIWLTREEEEQTESRNEENYKATIYNDFGLLKEVSFSTAEEKVTIPVQGYAPGNYYINVKDQQGNMITNQVVPVK